MHVQAWSDRNYVYKKPAALGVCTCLYTSKFFWVVILDQFSRSFFHHFPALSAMRGTFLTSCLDRPCSEESTLCPRTPSSWSRQRGKIWEEND